MKPFDDLLDRARANPKRIVLAEGEDPRIIEAAARAAGLLTSDRQVAVDVDPVALL